MKLGGGAKVPIASQVGLAAASIYAGVDCNEYTLNIGSADQAAHNNVTLTAPANCYVVPTTVDVPATGSTVATVYVPTTITGTVSVTASATDYANTQLSVQP